MLLVYAGTGLRCHGQAALLMAQSFGGERVLNPTGHAGLYFARICAATPTRVRRCRPGELGAVISRYHGISGYDWIAIPLIPYLYAVEDSDRVPAHANKAMVEQLRHHYHDRHLLVLGRNLREGGTIHHGWDQLAGTSYNRRMYALRFSTTPAEDDRLIAWLNKSPNRSHFHLVWNNCADFAAQVLDLYFPGAFHRRFLPDFGIVTPRQIAHELQRYGEKHRELRLAVFDIPQIPGYRRPSVQSKGVIGSFIATGDIVPVAILAPWFAAGLGADFLIWGRYPLDLQEARTLEPQTLGQLDAVLAPGPERMGASTVRSGQAALSP